MEIFATFDYIAKNASELEEEEKASFLRRAGVLLGQYFVNNYEGEWILGDVTNLKLLKLMVGYGIWNLTDIAVLPFNTPNEYSFVYLLNSLELQAIADKPNLCKDPDATVARIVSHITPAVVLRLGINANGLDLRG